MIGHASSSIYPAAGPTVLGGVSVPSLDSATRNRIIVAMGAVLSALANPGGLTTVYALGAVKEMAGSFEWGFLGISVLCIAGAALSVVLGRMRHHVLESQLAHG